jgi:hypothetical protein
MGEISHHFCIGILAFMKRHSRRESYTCQALLQLHLNQTLTSIQAFQLYTEFVHGLLSQQHCDIGFVSSGWEMWCCARGVSANRRC